MEIKKEIDHMLLAIMFNGPVNINYSLSDLAGKIRSRLKDMIDFQDPKFPIIEGPERTPVAKEDIPPEIPQYIFGGKAKRENWVVDFQFSRERIDLRFLKISNFNLEVCDNIVKEIHELLNQEADMLPSLRIGYFLQGKIISDCNKEYIEQFIIKEKFIESTDIEVHNREVMEFMGNEYNIWTRRNYLGSSEELLYVYDINTKNTADLSKLEDVYNNKIRERWIDVLDLDE